MDDAERKSVADVEGHRWHVLRRDPSLETLIDMVPGTRVWRDRPGGPWRVSPLTFSGEAAAAPEGD